MKKYIFIYLLSLTFNGLAQSKDSLKYNKFNIGFTFSPDYSYRILKTDASNQWIKDTYDTLEVSKYGYTTGLNIIFYLNKRLFFSSGLLFADKGERTKNYPIQPVNNYINHFYYLDIPIKANYYFKHKKYFYSKPKKIKVFLTGGTSVNVYLSSRTTTKVTNDETEPFAKSLQLSRLNFSFIAGLGMNCPITNKWYFKLESNYRRSITRVANAPVKKYFYSLGLNIGLFCKF